MHISCINIKLYHDDLTSTVKQIYNFISFKSKPLNCFLISSIQIFDYFDCCYKDFESVAYSRHCQPGRRSMHMSKWQREISFSGTHIKSPDIGAPQPRGQSAVAVSCCPLGLSELDVRRVGCKRFEVAMKISLIDNRKTKSLYVHLIMWASERHQRKKKEK